jgi:hypothetical protein
MCPRLFPNTHEVYDFHYMYFLWSFSFNTSTRLCVMLSPEVDQIWSDISANRIEYIIRKLFLKKRVSLFSH